MTLVLAGAGLLLFGGSGVYMLRAERSELTRAIEREVTLLGRVLQTATEQALEADDVSAVERLFAATTGRSVLEPIIELAAFDASGSPIAVSSPSPPLDIGGPLSLPGRLDVRRQDDGGGGERLVVTLPLRVAPEAPPGVLVITRPLTDMQAELRRTRRDIVATVLVFVVLTSVLGLVLGSVLVTQPLGRLQQALRRVQAGDLGSELAPLQGRDEVGMLNDEFNRMLRALRDARRQLDAEAETNRELQRSLQRAEKLITIGQLSAGLAHEIGSPLQVLGGRARQLAGRSDLPEDARAHAGTIARQSERIARIVEQLLNYSRRRPVQFAEVDPRACVSELVALLDFDARRRHVKLTCEVAPGLPRLRTDPDQIQQILFNLVTNALQATPAGGEVRVRVDLGPGDGAERPLRIRVGDSGPGISEADRERLFEPFFTARAGEGGVGLGLAVVRTLVTEHGGRIELDSAPGAGSEFTVALPRVHPAAGGTAP